MDSDPFEHVLYQILNTPLNKYPYTHFYVENIFPKNFYNDILSNLPTTEEYTAIAKLGRVAKGSYLERSLFPLISETITQLPNKRKAFWNLFREVFINEKFQNTLLSVFMPSSKDQVIPPHKVKYEWVVDLVRDTTNYSIGPHTDSPRKVFTLLFYLPENDLHTELGTSLFVPKAHDYSDPIGKSHRFEDFNLIKTFLYKPNSMFGFLRSDTSWHGVLPVMEKIERNSLTFQLILSNEDL